MQPDSELVAEARAWLLKARMDLDTAVFELTAEPPFAADVVFHAQQAAEQALKGVRRLVRGAGGRTAKCGGSRDNQLLALAGALAEPLVDQHL